MSNMGVSGILRVLLARFGARDILAGCIWYALAAIGFGLALLFWWRHWPGLTGAFVIATGGFVIWILRTLRKKI